MSKVRPLSCAHRSLWSSVVLVALASCGDAPKAATAHTALGGDVVARVADVSVPANLVGAVAAARGIDASAALNLLIDDAVAAKGASARGLDHEDGVSFLQLGVRARATIDRIKVASRASLPTDDEVRSVSAVHWLEVEVPDTMEVIHAVVLHPTTGDPGAAKALASLIAAAEVGATDAADFEKRANAVPHSGLDLKVETLSPFTPDGRIALPGAEGGYDARFAEAAATLTTPGATTGAIESAFGWHVIRLLARHPGKSVPFEERRTMYAQEVYNHRARLAVAELEATRASAEGVSMANGVDDLLAGSLPIFRTAEPDSTSTTDP